MEEVWNFIVENKEIIVPNKDQIMNEKLKNNPRLTNYIIKSTVNKALANDLIQVRKDWQLQGKGLRRKTARI